MRLLQFVKLHQLHQTASGKDHEKHSFLYDISSCAISCKSLMRLMPPSSPPSAADIMLSHSLPLFSPRHRSDHCSIFFFVFLQNGHCFVLLIYVSVHLALLPTFSPSTNYALSSIPSPWVCLSHLDTLHCQLSQGRMPPTEH